MDFKLRHDKEKLFAVVTINGEIHEKDITEYMSNGSPWDDWLDWQIFDKHNVVMGPVARKLKQEQEREERIQLTNRIDSILGNQNVFEAHAIVYRKSSSFLIYKNKGRSLEDWSVEAYIQFVLSNKTVYKEDNPLYIVFEDDSVTKVDKEGIHFSFEKR